MSRKLKLENISQKKKKKARQKEISHSVPLTEKTLHLSLKNWRQHIKVEVKL